MLFRSLGSIIFTRLVPALVIGGSLAACTVTGHGYLRTPGVIVYEDPPPPRTFYAEPRPGYIYIDGRWNWQGGRWVWANGYYVRERPSEVWVPGYWDRRDRGHVWVEGRWRARGHVDVDRRGGHDNGRHRGKDRGRVRDHTD